MLPAPFDWIVPIAAAPFVGSFLGVLADRLPAGEEAVLGRSHCRACGKVLSPLELLPVASWAMQSGKCRQCGSEIGWWLPGIEIAALAIAIWAAQVMDGPALWVSVALGWTLLALAVMDVRALFLSDWLTMPLVAAGAVVTLWLNPDRIPNHFAGMIAGAGVIVLLAWVYRSLRDREGIGMGDAKLLAAAGAWTGADGLGSVMLIGVAVTFFIILLQRAGGATIEGETPVPFGAGAAVGLWLVWLYGPLTIGA